VESYQNCNIFNDGAFDALKDRQQAEEAVIRLERGSRFAWAQTTPAGLYGVS
jgi:2-oxoglutarate ferredoxin oxidoreductase subunit beta